ncbi:hypothetical protein SteCoe_20480 [Stentor coeruleus]|uniref:Uncharacterized protein n=1 Tax=Stentor coeruleus TaxID=5963 RepID=A0A1R2BRL3_9CILI|nr:hypothetical protein SteCoe_20480 [Stentor coeruleus]
MNPNSSSLHTTSKSCKLLKIRKRINPESDYFSIEDDLVLEKQGNYSQFLDNPLESIESPSSLIEGNSEPNPRTIIGPKSLFATKQVALLNQQPALIKKVSLRSPSQKKASDEVVNYQLRYDEAIKRINQAKIISEQEEKQLLAHLSPREQIIVNRQFNVLQNFKKTQTYWKSIEKGLACKSNKNIDKLLSSVPYESKKPYDLSGNNERAYKPHLQDGLLWYMSLRDDPKAMKSETYLKVGPEFNGLYTRIQGSTRNADFINRDFHDDSPDLQVIGIGKLPLELEAVNRVGVKFLDTVLLDNQKYEETIAEHYDAKTRATNI